MTVLELIHSDLCDPISAQANDYLRYRYIYMLHYKSTCFEKFKEFKVEKKRQHEKYIKSLWFDHGNEYLSR